MAWTGILTGIALAFGMIGGSAVPVWADAWDRSIPSDGTTATRTELVHGSDELHDLVKKGPQPDEDWYRLDQQPYTSYEILAEATAGEIAPPIVERIASDGVTVLQAVSGIGSIGFSRSLRWQNGSTGPDDQYVRVRSGACVKCKKDAVYRIRAFETTYRLPRFNNAGTQVTVLLIQNPTDATITGTMYFWLANGTLGGDAATEPVPEIPGRSREPDRDPRRERLRHHHARRPLRRPCGQGYLARAGDRILFRYQSRAQTEMTRSPT